MEGDDEYPTASSQLGTPSGSGSGTGGTASGSAHYPQRPHKSDYTSEEDGDDQTVLTRTSRGRSTTRERSTTARMRSSKARSKATTMRSRSTRARSVQLLNILKDDATVKGKAKMARIKRKKKPPKMPLFPIPGLKRPKKSMSSFFLWSKMERAALKNEPGGRELSVVEVAKELGRRWKILPKKEKKKFMAEASRARRQYKKEVNIYRREAAKIKKPGNPPPPFKTPFEIYYLQRKKRVANANPDLSDFGVRSKIGDSWRAESAATKAKYMDKSAETKEAQMRYLDELRAYKRRTAKIKPPRRATSAYHFYHREVRPVVKQQHPKLNLGGLSAEVAAMWRSLADEEKSKYVILANDDKKRYRQDMLEYRRQLDNIM